MVRFTKFAALQAAQGVQISAAAAALDEIVSVSSASMPRTQLDMSFALLEETRALRPEVADMSMVSRPYPIRTRSDPIQELYELKKIVVAVQASRPA